MDSELHPEHFHKAQHNPDIDSISSIRLYEGTRVRQELVYGVVKDRKTGRFHHDYATFKTYRKSKQQPWKPDPKASFTLSEDKAQALTQALAFLATRRPAPENLLSPDAKADAHHDLIDQINQLDSEERLEIILRLLRDVLADPEPRQIMSMFEAIDAEQLASGARLFQIASWRKSLRGFHRLMRDPVSEAQQFSRFFAEYPWLIGHADSEPLGWEAVPEVLVYRGSDNWLELILTRTPLTEHGLFHGDERQGWHPVHELSQALGQAQILLEQLNPDDLNPRPDWTLQGVKARILIGHSRQDLLQEKALQRYNRHLHRIEVQTFDQLDKLALSRLSQLQVRLSPFKSQ